LTVSNEFRPRIHHQRIILIFTFILKLLFTDSGTTCLNLGVSWNNYIGGDSCAWGIHLPPPPGAGVLPENRVGVCCPLPKTLTLFMTKICDIPYPIYDLTKNSKPYFNYRKHNLWRAFVDFRKSGFFLKTYP